MTARNTVDPEIQELARRLLAYETTAGESSEETLSALFRVSGKFRRFLTTLIGVVGFRILLDRALSLAKRYVPHLNTLQVRSDGSLEDAGGPFGQDKVGQDKVGQDKAAGADVAFIAEFLALLVAFVGKDLALTLVLGAWPDLPVSEVDFWRKNDHGSIQ